MTENVSQETNRPTRRDIAEFGESINNREVCECEGCHALHPPHTMCDCGAASSFIHVVGGSYWTMTDEEGEPIYVDIDGVYQ